MSEFFVLAQFNQQPNPTTAFYPALEHLNTTSSKPVHDDAFIWQDSTITMGLRQFVVTPESAFEKPHHHQQVPYSIVADARLDNRQHLIHQLGLKPKTSPDDPPYTDGEIILQAYVFWGEQCVRHLRGDFTFVIWDAHAKHLFCARDPIGIHFLYYYFSPNELFACSNNLDALLYLPGVPNQFDEVQVVAHMLRQSSNSSQGKTVFQDIYLFPPATYSVVYTEKKRQARYWVLSNTTANTQKNAEDYASVLREVLTDAVRVRLRSVHTVGSHLSGGLDSSSIAVLAARELREKNQQLLCYTWSDPNQFKRWVEGDERYYIDVVAQQESLKYTFVTATVEDLLSIWFMDGATQPDMMIPREQPFMRQAQTDGVCVMLSGWGGDQSVSYHHYGYATDQLLKGRLKRVYRYLKHHTNVNELTLRRIAYVLMRHIGIYFLPDNFFYRYRFYNPLSSPPYLFIPPETMNRVSPQLEEKKRIRFYASVSKSIDNYYQSDMLLDRIEAWYGTGRKYRLSYRYPLLDQRLVEFAYHLPGKYYWHEGKDRYLFRMALQGILPNEMVWRVSKYDTRVLDEFDTTNISIALEIVKQNMIADKKVSQPIDWVDIEALQAFLRDEKSPEWANRYLDVSQTLRFWSMWHYNQLRQVGASHPMPDILRR